MDYTAKERFSLFCQYLGLGKVDSKLWFVGIEEGGSAVTKSNIQSQLKACKEQQCYFPDATNKTPVWRIIGDLIYPKYSKSNKPPITEFRKNLFMEEHSHFFLTELFPLSRPNISEWPAQYKELFGYSKEDIMKYLSDVRSTRYPIINDKWNEVKPSLTICFGSTYWPEFENLFKLGHSSFETYNNGSIRHYPKEKILLSKFFNNYLKIDERDMLRNWIGR